MSGHRNTVLVACGTWINNILNVTVGDATWTAITLGGTDKCRAIEAGLRSGGVWKLSNADDGATYRTVDSNIAMDIIKESDKTLFYAQTDSGADTLECILLD